MTEFNPTPPPELPALSTQLAGLLLRHILTGAGTTLVGVGALGNTDVPTFVTVGTGLLLAAAGLGWSVLSKLAARWHFMEALDAAPPKANP